MAKDKKAKTAEKKARVAQKSEKKLQQKEKKASTKGKGRDGGGGDGGDDTDDDNDLDAILASYAAQQERFLKVTEVKTEQAPSARSSATLAGNPANDNELFLFGGETFAGGLSRSFNDLFVYNIPRDEWRLVTSPNSPLPRSGHAWTRGGNAGGVYLFGGEFSSPKQGTFYHYNDFWRLEPSTREWTKIENQRGGGSGGGAAGSKGQQMAPSARSGHRMTFFKQYIILFGGFQDTSASTKYLNDLWLYDCTNYNWFSPVLPPASPRPDARSSFSLLPHDNGAVLYGGYSRVAKGSGAALGSGGKQHQSKKMTGSSSSSSKVTLKPLVHQDAWILRIQPVPAGAPVGTLPLVRWERRKRPVNAPHPPRAGATMAYHKGRGIQFGGVHDVENSDEGIESEFFNSLGVWNIERNRFFTLALRRPKQNQKRPVQEQHRNKRDRGKADEEELLKTLRELELRGKTTAAPAAAAQAVGGAESGLPDGDVPAGGIETSDAAATAAGDERDQLEKKEKTVMWEMPHVRFNAQLTVQDDVLYIFGGTFEKADREYTFDEMWSIDLGSLAGVKEIYKRDLEDWQGEESEDEEDEEDDDEEDEAEDEDDDEDDDQKDQDHDKDGKEQLKSPSSRKKPGLPSANGELVLSEAVTVDFGDALDATAASEEAEESKQKDDRPHPRPFESLRDFYARTAQEWQELLLADLRIDGGASGKSIKEVRKSAFEQAETKWWDSREEIQALEDEQEEAGIGEVVNLAEKAAAQSTEGGRRR